MKKGCGMKFDRPLVSLDIETTGTDASKDRLIQLGLEIMLPGYGGALFVTKQWLVNPGIPIPPAATAIHGITDTDVCDKPPFSFVATEIKGELWKKDLLGFNLWQLDLPILWDEFRRAGIDWNLDGVQVIDAGNIFKFKEPRTLIAAMSFYHGATEFKGHDALADARATGMVFRAQLERYPDLAGMPLADLAKFSRGEGDKIDFAGRLARDKDGDACFTFGKYKGQKVRNNIGYADWMMKNSFPGQTLACLATEIARIEHSTPEGAEEGEMPF